MSGATIEGPLRGQSNPVLALPVLALHISSWGSVCRRMTELLSDQRGRVQWWVELASQLDALTEGLSDFVTDREQGGELAGTTDAPAARDPRTIGWLRRLDGEWEQLIGHTASVRALVSRYAGDPMAVSAVTGSVKELMLLVNRFQQRSTEVLLRAGDKVPAPRNHH